MNNQTMTTKEFHSMLNKLTTAYANWIKDGFDGSVLEFLDFKIGPIAFFKIRFKPLDVIRELHKCNMKNDIFDETYDGTYLTNRFKILMGICEGIVVRR